MSQATSRTARHSHPISSAGAGLNRVGTRARPILAWCLALAGAGLVGAYASRRLQTSAAPGGVVQTRKATPDSARLASDVENLRRDVESLRAENLATRAARPAVQTPAPEPSSAGPLGPQEAAAAEGAERRRYQQHMEVLFHRQYRDVAWADETEQELRTAIGDLAGGTRARQVECAATMCKLVITHDDETQQRELAGAIGSKPPFQRSIYYAYDGLTTTLYVLKENEPFPSMD